MCVCACTHLPLSLSTNIRRSVLKSIELRLFVPFWSDCWLAVGMRPVIVCMTAGCTERELLFALVRPSLFFCFLSVCFSSSLLSHFVFLVHCRVFSLAAFSSLHCFFFGSSLDRFTLGVVMTDQLCFTRCGAAYMNTCTYALTRLQYDGVSMLRCTLSAVSSLSLSLSVRCTRRSAFAAPAILHSRDTS